MPSPRPLPKGAERQQAALDRAHALADAAERAVARAWARLLKVVRTARGPHDAPRLVTHARIVLAALGPELVQLLGGRLETLAHWGHASAADALADRLPKRLVKAKLQPISDRLISRKPLAEAAAPGLLTLGLTDTGLADTAFAVDELPPDELRDLFRSLIFPPPSAGEARALVYAGDWRQRLARETTLAAPHEVSGIVYRNVLGGRSIRDLARDLLPVLDGVRASARRVARDESMRVAHQAQEAAWAQVDDLVAGYQVNAVDAGHSPTSRPEHKKRHGTIYWKNPGPGQKGLGECPHPPFEADGTIAYNCRCWIQPVFAHDAPDRPTTGAVARGEPAPLPSDDELQYAEIDLEDRAVAAGHRTLDEWGRAEFGPEAAARALELGPRDTHDALATVHWYRSGGHNRPIATKLRAGQPLDAEEQAALDTVNRLASAADVPEGATLFRAVGPGMPPLTPGQTFADPAPLFVTASPAHAKNISGAHQGGQVLVIRTGPGARGVYMGTGEREFILPAGAPLRVEAVRGNTVFARYGG